MFNRLSRIIRTPHIAFAFSLVFCSVALHGQFHDPVKWATTYESVGDGEYDLIFTATIEEGWYVYSQYLEEGGPIPTSFTYEEGGHFTLVGQNEESGPKKEGHDAIFDMQLIKYYKEAVFKQRISVSDPTVPVAGFLEFMTCDDSNSAYRRRKYPSHLT